MFALVYIPYTFLVISSDFNEARWNDLVTETFHYPAVSKKAAVTMVWNCAREQW